MLANHAAGGLPSFDCSPLSHESLQSYNKVYSLHFSSFQTLKFVVLFRTGKEISTRLVLTSDSQTLNNLPNELIWLTLPIICTTSNKNCFLSSNVCHAVSRILDSAHIRVPLFQSFPRKPLIFTTTSRRHERPTPNKTRSFRASSIHQTWLGTCSYLVGVGS